MTGSDRSFSISTIAPSTYSVACGAKHPAYKILKDAKAPAGLKALANDRELANALRITEDEWKSLGSIKLPAEVRKEGYVQLLITIRAIS